MECTDETADARANYDASIRVPYLQALVQHVATRLSTVPVLDALSAIFHPKRYPADEACVADITQYAVQDQQVFIQQYGSLVDVDKLVVELGAFKQFIMTRLAKRVISHTSSMYIVIGALLADSTALDILLCLRWAVLLSH